MLRVFHVPSHLAYATALVDRGFGPVSSPTGVPLTVREVVALPSWEFFDVLHLHSIERATSQDIEQLCRIARIQNVRVVLTVHDLAPNIEPDLGRYQERLRLAAQRADAVLTLSSVAVTELVNRLGLDRCRVHLAPHGAALPIDVAVAAPRETRSRALAVFGALRPNRDALAVVRAWRLLPAGARPALRVLLRSVGPEDEHRYGETLQALRSAAAADDALNVTVTPAFVSSEELIRWLGPARALVLPYHRVTHSGQLELACDLGLPVLAPDVPTLRAQLEHNGAWRHPLAWYRAGELAMPRRLADRLAEVLRLPPVQESRRQAFLQRRRAERAGLLRLHLRVYKGHRS